MFTVDCVYAALLVRVAIANSPVALIKLSTLFLHNVFLFLSRTDFVRFFTKIIFCSTITVLLLIVIDYRLCTALHDPKQFGKYGQK